MLSNTDIEQTRNDKVNNISFLFVIFALASGVLMFVGLIAFDIKTTLIGAVLCNIYAPIVYCLPDELKLNSHHSFFGSNVLLKPCLYIIGTTISFYQLLNFNLISTL